MPKLKINDNRYINLLTEIKTPEAKYIKIGNYFGELTDDISKTNGKPTLCFSKNNSKNYIREKFEIKSQAIKWEQGTQWHITGGTVNSDKVILPYDKQTKLRVAINSDKFIAYRHNRSGSSTDDIWQSENGYSYTGVRYYTIGQGQCQTKTLNPLEITEDNFEDAEIFIDVDISDFLPNEEKIIWDKHDSTNTNLNCKIQVIAVNTGDEIQCFVRRICTRLGGDNTFILNLAHFMMIELS